MANQGVEPQRFNIDGHVNITAKQYMAVLMRLHKYNRKKCVDEFAEKTGKTPTYGYILYRGLFEEVKANEGMGGRIQKFLDQMDTMMTYSLNTAITTQSRSDFDKCLEVAKLMKEVLAIGPETKADQKIQNTFSKTENIQLNIPSLQSVAEQLLQDKAAPKQIKTSAKKTIEAIDNES